MLPFASGLAAISASFILPALAGLLVVAAAARVIKPRYLVAFAIGIYFLFFGDTLGGSAGLDINQGFAGGLPQLALLVLFASGVLLVFSLDANVFESGQESGRLNLAIPLLMAFAVGMHGFGEGAAFSTTAATTSSSSLLDAFGGVTAAIAFILHKALEPMMIGAVYWAYARDRANGTTGFVRDMLLLTLAFAVPGMIGGATDYYLSYDTTYPFAFGLGTSVYAGLRLVKPLFWDSSGSRTESLKTATCTLLGFMCIYVAALLHS